jgi:hypothetical protein
LLGYLKYTHTGVNHLLTMWARTVAPQSRAPYGRPGDCGGLPHQIDGWIMRRVIAIAVAGASLAGCSSFSLDAFKPTPQTVQVQLDSVPPGADAHTSLGPSCKTPCSVAVTPPESGGFSVSYALDKYQPATVQVQVTRVPGSFTTPASATFDPNPVVTELQPVSPPKGARKKGLRPKKPRPPKTAEAPEGSAFPEPAAASR